MIKEVWGNGTDVIIKYIPNGFTSVRVAASKWLGDNKDLSDNFLIKRGYRKLDISQF